MPKVQAPTALTRQVKAHTFFLPPLTPTRLHPSFPAGSDDPGQDPGRISGDPAAGGGAAAGEAPDVAIHPGPDQGPPHRAGEDLRTQHRLTVRGRGEEDEQLAIQ